jgi:hypothetical protein
MMADRHCRIRVGQRVVTALQTALRNVTACKTKRNGGDKRWDGAGRERLSNTITHMIVYNMHETELENAAWQDQQKAARKQKTETATNFAVIRMAATKQTVTVTRKSLNHAVSRIAFRPIPSVTNIRQKHGWPNRIQGMVEWLHSRNKTKIVA